MKPFAIVFALVVSTLATFAQPRIVTLVNDSDAGTVLRLEKWESAELVSSLGATVQISKEKLRMLWPTIAVNAPTVPVPLIIAGPAELTVLGNGFATFRITPEPMPVGQSLILAPGTNTVVVSFQSSTNLVGWETLTNIVFRGVPSALFFRLRLDGGGN